MRHRRTLGSAASKVMAGMLGVFSVWMMVAAVSSMKPVGNGESVGVAVSVVLLVYFLLLAAGGIWVAWRLWRHWSAATVRLAVGVAAGVGIVLLWRLTADLVDRDVRPRMMIAWFALVPLLAVGAVLYRKLSRATIRWADLDDPLDMYGHPAGHMGRTKLFCDVLGLSVLFASFNVAFAFDNVHDLAPLLGILCAVILGWATYRITLWWMTPPTYAALPPGGGFDVLPVEREPERQEVAKQA